MDIGMISLYFRFTIFQEFFPISLAFKNRFSFIALLCNVIKGAWKGYMQRAESG